MLAVAFAASAACGRSTPPTPSPGTDTPESIRGTERLGWDQLAGDAVELAGFRYAIYVDGSRSEIADVSCGATAGATGFPCHGRLPAMSPGAHTLELAAFVVDDGVRESPRSVPLRVVVTAVTTAQNPGASEDPSASRRKPQDIDPQNTDPVAFAFRRTIPGTIRTSDGVRLRIEVLAENLESPADLAFAADGLLFIAERDGRVRVFRDGQLQRAPALIPEHGAFDDGAALLGLAVDPQFERTRFVYALYAAGADHRAPAFRLARYRETNGGLAERAVVLDNIAPAAARPSGVLRFGPDRKLYAALDDGGDARRGEDLSSFGGKVLRLNQDGSTPADQPGATPIFSHAYPSPRGIGWQPATGLLWIAARERNGSERLRSSGGAAYSLPPGAGVSAVAFYQGDLIPELRSELLMAAREGGDILRLRFDPNEPHRVMATERLLAGIGAVTALAVGPDGAIYFCADGMLIRAATP